MGGRPGVMIYFNAITPALGHLSREQCGDLFVAIINYGMSGIEPELDPVTDLCFSMLRPSIDADGDRYQKVVAHGKYMAYVREARKKGEEPISESDYCAQLLVTDSNCKSPNSNSESNSESKSNPVSNPNLNLETDFETFWKAYPRKREKQDAKKAFAKVRVPIDVLLAAIEQQKASAQWQASGGRFIPYPASWLRKGGWEDEIETSANSIPSADDYQEAWK